MHFSLWSSLAREKSGMSQKKPASSKAVHVSVYKILEKNAYQTKNKN
jgi:hypothetical protein